VLRVVAELALVGAWETTRAGKSGKGVVNEQVGQECVYERVKGLVRTPSFSPYTCTVALKLTLRSR
jgi:hypothetical protein